MFAVVFFVVLAALCFVFAVNENLRGAGKEGIATVLGLLIFAWDVSAFFFLSWKWGVLAVVASFVLAALFLPVGRAVARQLGVRP